MPFFSYDFRYFRFGWQAMWSWTLREHRPLLIIIYCLSPLRPRFVPITYLHFFLKAFASVTLPVEHYPLFLLMLLLFLRHRFDLAFAFPPLWKTLSNVTSFLIACQRGHCFLCPPHLVMLKVAKPDVYLFIYLFQDLYIQYIKKRYLVYVGWEGESGQLIASQIRIASLLPSRSAMHGPIPLRIN